ncbi:MAG: hypothetical protein ACTHMS_16700 [Jatrophihabitans sp.]|uniref:hypothetical protein n=1 Tax=Jatrophihabitans sp. TaxID=1932789 RepID=UPI003F7EE912
MSWDWSTTVTGVVGIAGIAGTLVGGSRQINAQKDMAREERRERRLEASYAELLLKVAEADDWTYQLFLRWASVAQEADPPPQRPDLFVKTLGARGVLSVHWSPRVQVLVDELCTELDTCFRMYLRNQLALQHLEDDPAVDIMQLLAKFTGAKDRVSELDHRIRTQVSDEIAGRSDGSVRSA